MIFAVYNFAAVLIIILRVLLRLLFRKRSQLQRVFYKAPTFKSYREGKLPAFLSQLSQYPLVFFSQMLF